MKVVNPPAGGLATLFYHISAYPALREKNYLVAASKFSPTFFQLITLHIAFR